MKKKIIGIFVVMLLITATIPVIGTSEVDDTPVEDESKLLLIKANKITKNGFLDWLRWFLENKGVYINGTGITKRPLREGEGWRLILNFEFTNPEAVMNITGVFGVQWPPLEGPNRFRAVLFYGNVEEISPGEYHIEGYCLRIEIWFNK